MSRIDFQQYPPTQFVVIITPEYEGVFMLSEKVSKLSITFILCFFLILHRLQSAEFCEIVVS
jgi:hypothetical protein